jgi:hypothetical protein
MSHISNLSLFRLVLVLTPARRRVLQVAREEPRTIAHRPPNERDIRVRLDVDLLEKFVLDIEYYKRPGQAFRTIVRPAAANIHLTLTI